MFSNVISRREVQPEKHPSGIDVTKRGTTKAQTESELSQIPGLGQKKIDSLLKAFGSTESIKKATAEELISCTNEPAVASR